MTTQACDDGQAELYEPAWDGAQGCPLRAERRDAAEHRRRILLEARALFAAHGVSAVTMQQIARAAGVGQGTLYRRYAHKDQLCLDLLGDSIAAFRAGVQSLLASEPGPAQALRIFEAVLARLVAFNEDKGPLLAAVDDAWGGHRAALYHSPFYQWLHSTVVTLLERAVVDGEIELLDVPYAADAILAALAINLYRFQRQEQGYTRGRIMSAMRRLYCDGLRQGLAQTVARRSSTGMAHTIANTMSRALRAPAGASWLPGSDRACWRLAGPRPCAHRA